MESLAKSWGDATHKCTDTVPSLRIGDAVGKWRPASGNTGRVQLDIQKGGESATQVVGLTWKACNFGGRRPYWVCPDCERRVSILFLRDHFACRHCHALAYRSQRETELDAVFRRLNSLRRRLGWPAGLLTPMLGRPYGMHATTYAKLLHRHAGLAHAASVATLAAIGARL